MNKRERLLGHVAGRPVDHLPFVPLLMHLSADAIGVKYGEYVRDPSVMARGAMASAMKYGTDHVTLTSDPCRETADFGGPVLFHEDSPPTPIDERSLLLDKGRIESLELPQVPGTGRMAGRIEAIRQVKSAVGEEMVVEGWVEGPMGEAANLRGMQRLMVDLVDDGPFVNRLFEIVVENGRDAGADVIGVGDPAASLVGPKLYQKLIWSWERRLIQEMRNLGVVVRLHICGRTSHHFKKMGELGADIIDLDSMAPMDEARAAMGPEQILLGNVDTIRILKDGSPGDVTAAVAECHKQAGPRFIVGAGCEVPRGTPEANLKAMREYAATHTP